MRKWDQGHTGICLLLVFLLLTLSACTANTKTLYHGLAEEDPDSILWDYPPEVAAELLVPEELVKVGFVQVGHESDWRIAATKSCREVFCEENGYELSFVDADNNPEQQLDAVRNFIRERVDYIVIDPILTTGWDAVLTEAYHADIPVIIVDRTITCRERYYTAWIGSDFVREGEYAGAWLQHYLERNGRGKATIRIVTINGTMGAAAQIGRTEGFARYLEQNQNWHHLAQESGDFTEAGGRQVMERYLEKFVDIDVVVCQNDNEALGACRALDEAGISHGPDGEVVVISFDATKAGLEAVLDGQIHADFECNPLSPRYAAEVIQRLEAGEVLEEKRQILPEECFTADQIPVLLKISDNTKRTVPVTRELLEGRTY